jgi:hypothetical protein
MFNQRIIYACAVILTGISMQGADIMIQKQPVKLLPPQSKTFKVEVPGDWKKCFLKVDARMEYSSKQRIGSHYAFHAEFNGKNLDSHRLVNYPNPLYFRSNSGRGLYIYSKPHEMYRTFYSPDFEKYPKRYQDYNPDFAPEYPYTYVFDVTDLVKKNRTNIVTLKNKLRHYDFPVFCQNIEIISDYKKMKDYAADGGGTLKEPVIPIDKYIVDYNLKVLENGGMRLTVNGDTYNINSFFSYPEGKWNSLALHRANSEWQVKILNRSKNKIVLKGTGKYYSVYRTINLLPDRISVRDTITNLTANDLGMIARRVITDNGNCTGVRLAGFVIPSMTGKFSAQVRTSENPTLYVQRKNSGLGLFAMDDVFRADTSMTAKKNKEYALENCHLVLAPKKSYTAVFDIYPTAKADYFQFVNAARHNLQVNFTIDGNLTFAHSFEKETTKRPQKDFADLIRFNKPKYVGLNSMGRILPNGRIAPMKDLSSMTWGSLTLLDDKNKYTRQMLLDAKKRFQKVDPDLKFVVYHNCFIGALPEPEKTHPDSSLWYDSRGKLVKYTKLKGARMTPRVNNAWGKDLQKVYEFYRDNGLGIFWDESTAEPFFAYNGWDGYSGVIDPKTFKLTRKIRNVALDSLQFRLNLLDFCEKNKMPVWCNFMPATTTMSKRKVYRFVEGHSPLSAVRTHFYTPVSWGTPHTEVSESDITDSMKNKLANGGLYMYYSTKFTSDNNFMQDLYPFTPIELHSGYVIGKEKILTMRDGKFGWNDASPITVKIYDRTGHLTKKKTPVIKIAGKTFADLKFDNGDFAIIYRNKE